jgi:hypothetical protein
VIPEVQPIRSGRTIIPTGVWLNLDYSFEDPFTINIEGTDYNLYPDNVTMDQYCIGDSRNRYFGSLNWETSNYAQVTNTLRFVSGVGWVLEESTSYANNIQCLERPSNASIGWYTFSMPIGGVTFDVASSTCAAIDRQDGLPWRLPTVSELSFTFLSQEWPGFEANKYWSDSPYPGLYVVYIVDMSNGVRSPSIKVDPIRHYVRCARLMPL